MGTEMCVVLRATSKETRGGQDEISPKIEWIVCGTATTESRSPGQGDKASDVSERALRNGVFNASKMFGLVNVFTVGLTSVGAALGGCVLPTFTRFPELRRRRG